MLDNHCPLRDNGFQKMDKAAKAVTFTLERYRTQWSHVPDLLVPSSRVAWSTRSAVNRIWTGILFLALSLSGTVSCGKSCDGWTFHSQCEGNVAPQCLGGKLEPTHVVRVDCTQTGMICANPESGEHARQAFCYPVLGTCDPASFVPQCGPYSRLTRCVRGHIIDGEGYCLRAPLRAPAPADAGIEPVAEANNGEIQPEKLAETAVNEKGHPICTRVGTRSEGWAWPSGRFLHWAKCKGVVPRCHAVDAGHATEGWYAVDTLIAAAHCQAGP